MQHSVEMEILDQALTGPMSLAILRGVSPSDDRFLQAVRSLLHSGDLALLAVEGVKVPEWRWRALFDEREVLAMLDAFQVEITDQGASRVA